LAAPAADGFSRRRGHVHHQLDDVARGAELPVLPGGVDLAEHVLVEIALGVAVGHVDAVELVDGSIVVMNRMSCEVQQKVEYRTAVGCRRRHVRSAVCESAPRARVADSGWLRSRPAREGCSGIAP